MLPIALGEHIRSTLHNEKRFITFDDNVVYFLNIRSTLSGYTKLEDASLGVGRRKLRNCDSGLSETCKCWTKQHVSALQLSSMVYS
jgi:hypothetical protein